MSVAAPDLQNAVRSWEKEGFLLSTNKSLLSIPAMNSAFDSDYMYWASPLPTSVMQRLIDSCLCLGLYKTDAMSVPAAAESPQTFPEDRQTEEQIGFARIVTDYTTFAYLTDVYVVPAYRGLGLGGWMLDAVDELLGELPYLRWAMLRTSMEKSKIAYRQRLGMNVLEGADNGQGDPCMMGRKGPALRG